MNEKVSREGGCSSHERRKDGDDNYVKGAWNSLLLSRDSILYDTIGTIPEQFKRNDFLFVPVPRGEKAPRMHGWNLVAKGMRYDDKRLDNGGNYSVYAAPGSTVLFLDVDDAERFDYSILGGETFTYSAWPDSRRYRAVVECPDYPRSWAGKKMRVLDGALEIHFGRQERPVACSRARSFIRTVTCTPSFHDTSFRTASWRP